MTFDPSVSLVIVSRDRPSGLKRLISALRYQSYRKFEVIVVSNVSDTTFLADLPGAKNIRHIYFDQANISMARNIGISNSCGEFVAFCDDDAVPEPCWLERLIEPFCDGSVASTGGYIRGRNGIDFQWKAIKCDRAGDDFPLDMPPDNMPATFQFDGTYFAKVQGTNCAFRKTALIEIGGFDENYRFFLDETDVALSLALTGWSSTIVPLAEVQHGFEESAERTKNRVPKTLENIGASKAYFLEKFQAKKPDTSIEGLIRNQHARLIRLMRDGHIEPRDVGRLENTLKMGLINSSPKTHKNVLEVKDDITFSGFLPDDFTIRSEFVALAGNLVNSAKLNQKAAELVSQHQAVMVFRFTYTALFHKRFFDSRGYWVQAGGLFGRSNRTDRLFKFWRSKKRVTREVKTLADQKKISDIQFFKPF
jgi:glycosyltransferase involved in cell wall biosynthesis